MKLVAVLNRYENSKEIDLYYMKAIKKFGATPVLINEDNLDLLEKCGGILLTGGDNKGTLDDYLIKYSFDNKIPLLGICQGMQSMALYNTNNTLVDVQNHYNCKHLVNLNDSKFKDIVGKRIVSLIVVLERYEQGNAAFRIIFVNGGEKDIPHHHGLAKSAGAAEDKIGRHF